MKNKSIVIGIDFDGTCVTHEFPNIGKDIGAVHILKRLVEKGHKLVLFTMRSDSLTSKFTPTGIERPPSNYLSQAVDWFRINKIKLYGVQVNPEQHTWTTSPKAYCNLYIDDAALGCPLVSVKTYSNKPFVDWRTVENMLVEKGLL